MKRFTETAKWNDPWYRKLSPVAKLLWSWLTDNCDAAGVIEPDWGLAGFQIGMEIDSGSLSELGDRIEKLPCGKYLIPGFISFQVGTPSRDCKAHKPIFLSVEKHKIERVLNGYQYPLDTVQEKDKDKEKEKVKDRIGGAGERGDGVPSSEDAARSAGEAAGVPGDYAATIWNEHEGTEWSDSYGRPITNFSKYIKSRYNNRVAKHAREERQASVRTGYRAPPKVGNPATRDPNKEFKF